jgi:signal transduction histidine kinase
MDGVPGFVLGAIPYSRSKAAPGWIRIEERLTTLAVHRSNFGDLTRECPALTTALVHRMVDRAREFNSIKLNEDRMQAMGRLASGLAHELNNPAAGASRAAQSLALMIDRSEMASRALAAARLSDSQIEVIDEIRRACKVAPGPRAPLEAADREDAFSGWLAAHGVAAEKAEALASSNLDIGVLDRLADAGLSRDSLASAIEWLTSGIAAREMAHQIALATRRIHELVAAVKGFTFLDRDAVPGAVDIAQGIADTIALLSSKARARSVDLQVKRNGEVPTVYGFGAEINQVWEKIIDNAIDATGPNGTVTIALGTESDRSVRVSVTDTGSGIPAENRVKIFDPFFTTKPVGQGSGLGLTLARRIVDMHHGGIALLSRPGHTEFEVTLPTNGISTPRDVPLPTTG